MTIHPEVAALVGEITFDPDALLEKYLAERDKRLRPDGNNQYFEVKAEFSRYVEDPYVEPGFVRAPIFDEVEFAIIGGGFGGLLMGARLREAGIERIRVVESAGDFGGTWYWNRYPGAMCDVESYCYLPLLEELGYMPKHKYSFAPEILEHSRRIARHYRLYDDALMQTDCSGNLTGLKDKRVGIIGTGATAIQCVPHLGESSKQLYVFQRTPSSVDVRNNADTDTKWATTLQPGWQKRRMENFNILVSGGDQDEDLVHDGWTEIFRSVTGVAAKEAARKLGRRLDSRERAELMVLADYKKMNQIRARVDAVVKDPVTAAALKPWYRQFCKRPCFHDEYLQTYNRPNVRLVDTEGRGVDRLTETGVVANGQEYKVDCLIFATGFEVGTSYTRRAGYDIVGRGGKTLSQHWSGGLRTLHGLTTSGFPNCFFLGFTQTAITISVPQALSEQAQHVTYLVTESKSRGAQALEPTVEAESAYVQEVRDLARLGERFYRECTPGYYNSEGEAGNRRGLFSDFYGAGPLKFFEVLDRWRSDGKLAGLALS